MVDLIVDIIIRCELILSVHFLVEKEKLGQSWHLPCAIFFDVAVSFSNCEIVVLFYFIATFMREFNFFNFLHNQFT